MSNKNVKLYKQSMEAFPEQIQDIFHLLSISSNYFLIGSAQYKNFLYSSDYDLNETYKSKDTKQVLNNLYENFKEKFIEAKKDPNIFITDFKCGIDKKGEPIRWSYDDIMKGTKGNYKFVDCLLMKSTMKLDMIVFINGCCTEITDNYFLTIGKTKNFDLTTKNDLINMLVENYNELIKEHKYFKAIKRLFSIQALQNKPSKKLIELLNSDLGRLYKTMSDLNTILELFEQTFKPCPLDKIKQNLQIIKYFVSKITSINVNFVVTELQAINKYKKQSEIVDALERLCDKVNTILNSHVKNYLVKL